MKPNVRHPLIGSPYLRATRPPPFVAFVEDALPVELCDALVARIEAESPRVAPIMTGAGPVMRLDVRNNERVIFDDAPLAADLFARTRAFLPESLAGGTLVGYNERFRGYRYRGGQRFAPHFDGAYFRPDTPRGREGSQITALFYLNEGFTGGETKLLDWDVVIEPKQGSIFFFEHAMLHEGCPVSAGTKYVLRSDAMYWFARP
ncbi:MAG: 2OG-Fe(II) oxygenase [Polyangia bacterium]